MWLASHTYPLSSVGFCRDMDMSRRKDVHTSVPSFPSFVMPIKPARSVRPPCPFARRSAFCQLHPPAPRTREQSIMGRSGTEALARRETPSLPSFLLRTNSSHSQYNGRYDQQYVFVLRIGGPGWVAWPGPVPSPRWLFSPYSYTPIHLSRTTCIYLL